MLNGAPKHELVKVGYSPSLVRMMPTILDSDPCVRWIGGKTDDIVRITRAAACECYFRRVVASS